MQTIVAALIYMGLMQSPTTTTATTNQTAVNSSNMSVDGTPVIIDIQEF